MPPLANTPVFFSHINVTPQVFHRTSLSFALVNLKPLVPGHVLVCPNRPIPRFADLIQPEMTDLFITAQRVSTMIQRAFNASAVNIAVQDGKEAGQTVAHVHVHVIPRRKGDFGGQGDRVYERLEGPEGDVGSELRKQPKEGKDGRWGIEDGERRERSEDEMKAEADWLRELMEKDGRSEAEPIHR